MPHKPKIKLGDLPEQVQKALEFAVDRKAVGPVIMQVSELAGYTDWVVIVSATSQRHAQGISDAIVRGLRGIGCRPLGTDGLAEHTWALLDYDDFIVHVFYHPVRDYYDLESMWSDAPRVELGLPDAVMDTSGLGGLFSPEPTSAPTNDDQFAGYDDEFDDDDFDENYEDEAEYDDDDDDGEYDDLLGEDEADKAVEREDIASG